MTVTEESRGPWHGKPGDGPDWPEVQAALCYSWRSGRNLLVGFLLYLIVRALLR
jgi:hypothetical protein